MVRERRVGGATGGTKRGSGGRCQLTTRGPEKTEFYPEPDLDIPILPEDPEVIAETEGVHERIQAEIQHKDIGGRGRGGNNVRSSTRMECCLRSGNGR